MLGKDELAKWTLLSCADKELDDIVRRNSKKVQLFDKSYVHLVTNKEIKDGKKILISQIGSDSKEDLTSSKGKRRNVYNFSS